MLDNVPMYGYVQSPEQEPKVHECPECGQACDCDEDDIWSDVAADDCVHPCDEDDDEDDSWDCEVWV